VKLVRTCDACPTQYDVTLEDGRYVYFRFRHGRWAIRLFENEESFDYGNELAVVQGSPEGAHPLDGFLTHEEVVALLEEYLPSLGVTEPVR
jgi:hypothetical protein